MQETLLQRYIREISEELKIDEMNIAEASLRAPARTHHWLARLITHEEELENEKSKKKDVLDALVEKAHKASPIGNVSKIELSKMVENTDEIKKQNDKIKDLERTIKYLNGVIDVYGKLTYNLKNFLTRIQQETM